MTSISVPEAVEMALNFIRSGNLGEANNLCDQVLKVAPSYPGGHLLASLLAMTKEDYGKSIEHSEIFLSNSFKDYGIDRNICRYFEDNGKEDSALNAACMAFERTFSPHVKMAFGSKKDFSIADIIKNNRKILQSIPRWIEDDVYNNSVMNYGLPQFARPKIDLNVGYYPIYADLIVYMSKFLDNSIRYLEIGVSVGKTFYLMLENFKESKLTAFDIEDINPTLSARMSFVEEKKFSRNENSLRKADFSEKEFRKHDKNNIVNYIAGDVLDRFSWERLQGKKYNLIFSDAMHTAEAINFEMDMLIGLDLIDDREFIVVWDDLESPAMTEAFKQISGRLADTYNLPSSAIFTVDCGGWLGRNEHLHKVGVVVKPRRR
ncbi:hypothetical protein J2848_005824 [Azospirillum lipoferum]|uniref:Class I SAM-dependent methyltransferase n=1 Tax=Azospirillum lipoferum TaxID=193 RepID=A0A5A9GHK1_AZOLI|nr:MULTISPECIES: class I SAM-dependent methyltransferase [Azospirillum]KAA0593816.1 class I SAM-dependent methyltransferase [Azospirillum lipoferum]MCP1614121.1 hypothetical protein [Azospirillum lipoferum]MDW5536807.1 class I SAM-dependent methyltransferase [Azospirillum sp. NL1]